MRRWLNTVAVLTVAFAAVACGGGDDPAVDDVTNVEPAEPSESEPTDPEPDAGVDAGQEPASEAPDAGGEEIPETAPETAPEEVPETAADAGPEPSAEAIAEPCAEHADRIDEMFIELVAPVDEQHVDGEVEIVGCSNVNEATVSYRVLDGDGRTLHEGFTTAECGTGCVGEFRDVVDLSSAAGEPVAHLQVYSQSMADGSEEALTEVVLVLE